MGRHRYIPLSGVQSPRMDLNTVQPRSTNEQKICDCQEIAIDFDLLFGAAKLNMKILDMPVRYKERVYGETNIQRWRHGVILLKMVVFAARRIKFF